MNRKRKMGTTEGTESTEFQSIGKIEHQPKR